MTLALSLGTSSGTGDMLSFLVFKTCHSCAKGVSNNDPHLISLKCLWVVHMSDKCSIRKDFKCHSKKDRAARLKYLLLELVLRCLSEPFTLIHVLSTLASVSGTSLVLLVLRDRSVSLVPKKRHCKSDLVPESSKEAKRLSLFKDSEACPKRRHSPEHTSR